MSAAAFELQKAVYTMLNGSPGVSCPVHDHVPQATTKPYIVIGDGESNDWGTDDNDGELIIITVTAFSDQHRGRKSVKQIQSEVHSLLHHTEALSVTGYQVVLCQFADSDSVKMNDGATYESEARYRVLLNAA